MPKASYYFFFLCVFLLLIKITSIRFSNLDLFGDEAQYWLWSQKLDFGYFSKPPLLSWIIWLVCTIFGSSFFVLKMIPVFLYCLTSVVIFFISKKLLNNFELAFWTSITFFLMPGVSVSSFLVSTDILLILFWSLSLLQLLNIRENPSNLNFILLGIFVGLAFLAKYAAIYFIICMFFLFFEKEMKQIFLKHYVGLLYFSLTAFMVVAPNILWNIDNGWITLKHISQNADLSRASFNIFESLKFVGSQIIMVGPLIVLFFVYNYKNRLNNSFDFRFLAIFSLPIFLIVFVESLLVRANANWAAVALVGFLIMFVHVVFKLNKNIIVINNLINIVFGIIFFLLVATTYSNGPFRKISGIKFFAEYLVAQSDKKIENLVIADRMLFSNLSYIFYKEPVKIYTPFTPDEKINNHFQITNPLPAHFNKNFIFLGDINQIKYLKNKYTFSHVETKAVRFRSEPIKIYEIIF